MSRRIFLSVVICFLSVVWAVPMASALSTAAKAPTAAANSNLGYPDWGSTSNVYANDGNTSSVTIPTYTGASEYIEITNFGFAIPDGATIDGVEVVVEHRVSYGYAGPATIELIYDDGVEGSGVISSITSTFTAETVGGPSDTWAAALNSDKVNDSSFGVQLSVSDGTMPSGGAVIHIDYVTMKIYYTPRPVPAIGVDSDPSDDATCNGTHFYDASYPFSFTAYIVFDKSVTTFMAESITISAGSKGTFTEVSSTEYTLEITNVTSPTTTVTVSVGEDTVPEGNDAASTAFVLSTNSMPVCDIILDNDDNLWWELDESSGTSIADSVNDGAGGDDDQTGTLNAGTATLAKLKANDQAHNASSILLDGTSSYIYRDDQFPASGDDGTYYISLWAQSQQYSATSATVMQISDDDDNGHFLTIGYRNDVTNNLYVTHKYNGSTTTKRSSTSVDPTAWNNIFVEVSSNALGDIYVNGSDVDTSNATTIAPGDATIDKFLVGASYNGTSYSNHFKGYIDDVLFMHSLDDTEANAVSTFSANRKTTCYNLTSLPSGVSAQNTGDSNNSPTSSKYCGLQSIRLLDNSVPVMDVDLPFVEDESASAFVADTNVTDPNNPPATPKAVVKVPTTVEEPNKHTMYLVKGSTSSFILCPDPATDTLDEVSDSCPNKITYNGPFPQTQNGVTVETTSINSVTYWKVSNLTSSGGQGGGGGADPVPEFSHIAFLLLLIACGWVLHRNNFLQNELAYMLRVGMAYVKNGEQAPSANA